MDIAAQHDKIFFVEGLGYTSLGGGDLCEGWQSTHTENQEKSADATIVMTKTLGGHDPPQAGTEFSETRNGSGRGQAARCGSIAQHRITLMVRGSLRLRRSATGS